MKIKIDSVRIVREELVFFTQMAFTRGLSSGVSGNTSARLPDNPNLILIKSSGSCFGQVRPSDFVLVDVDGNHVDGEGKPSKEMYFHCGIYRERPEIGAVFHGHSAYATAYATEKGELPMVTAAARALIGRTALVDFAPAGSRELADMVVAAFTAPDVKCCVLKTHGFVATGADIARAFYMGDVLEDNAKVACIMATLR